MCEQTEINYLDGEVVWVKLGSCWWPGEVIAPEKLPPDVLPSFRKPPIAVVKFFQEDTYEYVKNINSIYKYNCSRKSEFINKGLYMYRTKHGHMEKFPEDVIRAETAVDGDIEILTRDEFQEPKKESYAGLFGDPKKTPISGKKGKGRGRPQVESPQTSHLFRKIKEKTDYKVHILVQGSKSTPSSEPAEKPETSPTPSTSAAENNSAGTESTNLDDKPQNNNAPMSSVSSSPTTSSGSGIYACHACPFNTTRLNVLIMHNKTHSVTFMPYTPSPVRKKPVNKSPKSTSNVTKTPKPRKPRTEKPKKVEAKKRTSVEKLTNVEVKKPKTDEEIKSSLLADWDDGDDDFNDESNMMTARSPEVPVGAESPAVPTSAEISVAQVPDESSTVPSKQSDSPPQTEKPESSSDSKYDFCEDEDWPIEADAGRKIPRVKNPKKTEETKSLSLDDDDMSKEVAELLNKTAVPELPSIPEPLKIEENFPELSIVKSPDKKIESTPETVVEKASETPPTKAIFKTKTFFRSRHSRSQDAIGKYVAEQLNAVDRMDITDCDLNGSEVVSSPEARESPPIEQVKVARLAPKIQLKKMKAEAAQMREKEKSISDFSSEVFDYDLGPTPDKSILDTPIETVPFIETVKDNKETLPIVSPSNNGNDEILSSTKQDNNDVEDTIQMQTNFDLDNKELPSISMEDNSELNTNGKLDDMNQVPEMEFPEPTLPDTEEHSAGPIVQEKPLELPTEQHFMNESTASAVDALLSVSREADRVTRVISDDPPEDLFEDDNTGSNSITNETTEIMVTEDCLVPQKELESTISHETVIDSDNAIVGVAENPIITASVVPEFSIDVNIDTDPSPPKLDNEIVVDKMPTESDLQIAETLINLPASTLQTKSDVVTQEVDVPMTFETDQTHEEVIPASNDFLEQEIQETVVSETEKVVDVSNTKVTTNDDSIEDRYESEQEKSENLNAAQSLVQMSECIDHNVNVIETVKSTDIVDPSIFTISSNNGLEKETKVKKSSLLVSNKGNHEQNKVNTYEAKSSKLLKILEEPCKPKPVMSKTTPTKQIIMPGKEKILNFDVAKSVFKSKPQSPKQKIIIRRTTPGKNVINNFNEITTTGPEKIILSRSGNISQEGSSVQTYTIQTSPDAPSDANTIIIQQKIRKFTKPPAKLPKLKPQTSLVAPITEVKTIAAPAPTDDAMFDINAMPIVLSEDLLTPESIEKMPIVMSDANIITPKVTSTKITVKSKQNVVENEKIAITSGPPKQEVKTLLVNPVTEVNKTTTPNILSKSSKMRGAKPMLVIDKTTGKQKIIMTKSEPVVRELPQPQAIIQTPQPVKPEKFLILPTQNTPRPGRAQKIVIDPQTGKAHMILAKPNEPPLAPSENKPVSAKLMPSNSDTSAPGNTVMIITNAQGAQSRIVLTPEHEKILFPNKQQPNLSQLKTVTHRIATNPPMQKTIITSIAPSKSTNIAPNIAPIRTPNIAPVKSTNVAPAKTPTRIVPKQKSAIITSKGQLIVGGRVATTAQNIAPMPELRTFTKRAPPPEPKKVIQKTNSEPIIFLQQKSGAVMQLTAAQFEHLQRTGQIVQKILPAQEKVVIQKAKPADPKSRVRKPAVDAPTPAKKLKQEIAIAPSPVLNPLHATTTLISSLSSVINSPAVGVPTVSNTISVPSSSTYSEFENFEELLPSTAIAKQVEPVPPPEPVPEPAAVPPLDNGQLLAVPGEHFGGPVGTFYLCIEDNGTFTSIDNRPLVLENNQLVPMESVPVTPQLERRDILEAALANSDVFHADGARDEAPEVPDFRDLNANVSVHCRVSETSTTLNQPIMTPVEVPTKGEPEPAVPSTLEDGLAVIGVTPHSVPTSLELPITVTDPRIAPKTTDPLSNNNYGPRLVAAAASGEMYGAEAAGGPMSMPLLTEEEAVGKSMPILTDEVTVSSVESLGSPASLEEAPWARAPASDSDLSAEVPLQPALQLSVADLAHHT